MAFLESLESRLFLSVTPGEVSSAVKVIKTEEKVVVANLNLLEKQGKADFAVLEADVKRLHTLKADKSLGVAISDSGGSLISTLKSVDSKGSALVNRDIAKLDSYEARLAKKPTNTVLSSDASAALTKLTADASGLLTTLSSDASTATLFNDINAVGTANSTDSKTQTDVATMESDVSNNLNNAGMAAQAAYTTDVTNLEDLFAMAM